ncbi:MAG TPA: adenylyl-sulfate kinase [Polyangiaceae bacterium]|jgi:adenylyl-sulfate kinase|nr:MAG: putative adenylyl-sulfate kinase [Deltaproteobacteria bacterium ADurb.Bin207]HOD24795.1 adenylyl-sulfate kinase [Polyangiaceae bacterium]HQB42170.1 adenylyl-sulfate kinase [Polyangiaceae bacterium]HQK16821.1 adenylyl-sulfate kinase [Polyangiaceae bacterium]
MLFLVGAFVVRVVGMTGTSHGLVVWLTGLPAAGKSTLALALRDSLEKAGQAACIIDGDVLRQGLCSDLGFSAKDRQENVRRAGEIAKIIAEQGIIAIVALVSPYERDRRAVRERLPPHRFFEVHVDCSVEECRRRDPKGLYRRADRGQIPQFTGVSDPYEAPSKPELRVRTQDDPVQVSLDQLLAAVTEAIKR